MFLFISFDEVSVKASLFSEQGIVENRVTPLREVSERFVNGIVSMVKRKGLSLVELEGIYYCREKTSWNAARLVNIVVKLFSFFCLVWIGEFTEMKEDDFLKWIKSFRITKDPLEIKPLYKSSF